MSNGIGLPAPSQLLSPTDPTGSQIRGTALAVIVSVDNATNPRYATIAVQNNFPFEGGYLLPTGCGPFAAGGTSGFNFFYNNSGGTGGSIVNVDLDSRMVTSFTGDSSSATPTPFYKAITDHKHSGNLNPDGFTNPTPVNLSASETQNLLPYPQNSLPIQGVIDSTSNILSTEFAGGKINGNGELTNVDGASSTTQYSFAAGQSFSASADIKLPSTSGPGYLILGNQTNGYSVRWSGTNISIGKFVAGVEAGTASAVVTIPFDTNYHTFRLSILPGSPNTINASIDNTYLTVTDSSLNLASGTWPVTLYTGGSTGKVQHYTASATPDHWISLPIGIRRPIDEDGSGNQTDFWGSKEAPPNSALAGYTLFGPKAGDGVSTNNICWDKSQKQYDLANGPIVLEITGYQSSGGNNQFGVSFLSDTSNIDGRDMVNGYAVIAGLTSNILDIYKITSGSYSLKASISISPNPNTPGDNHLVVVAQKIGTTVSITGIYGNNAPLVWQDISSPRTSGYNGVRAVNEQIALHQAYFRQSAVDAQSILGVGFTQKRNLVVNGMFNVDPLAAGGGWKSFGAPTTALAGTYTVNGVSYTAVHVTGPADSGFGIYQNITVKPGTKYSYAILGFSNTSDRKLRAYIADGWDVSPTVQYNVGWPGIGAWLPIGAAPTFYTGQNSPHQNPTGETVQQDNWNLICGTFTTNTDATHGSKLTMLLQEQVGSGVTNFYLIGAMVWEGDRWQDFVDGDPLLGGVNLTIHVVDTPTHGRLKQTNLNANRIDFTSADMVSKNLNAIAGSDWDTSNDLLSSRPLKGSLANSIAWRSNAKLWVNWPAASSTATYWIDDGGGTGTDPTIWNPDGTTVAGVTNLGGNGFGGLTGGIGISGLSSGAGQKLFFCIYYLPGSSGGISGTGWFVSYQQSAFGINDSAVAQAYADGGYTAFIATTNATTSGFNVGSSGGRSAGGGGRALN